MSQTKNTPASQHVVDDPNEPVPMMQLGVLIPMVVYSLWGVIDILTVPLAK